MRKLSEVCLNNKKVSFKNPTEIFMQVLNAFRDYLSCCYFPTTLNRGTELFITNYYSENTLCLIPCHISECVCYCSSSNIKAITRSMGLGDCRCHARVISSSRFCPCQCSRGSSRWHHEVERFWTAIYNRWCGILTNNCLKTIDKDVDIIRVASDVVVEYAVKLMLYLSILT